MRRSWVALVVASGLLSCGPADDNPSWSPSGGRGVIVERVGEGSALERAGVKPEDVLLSWKRLPPLANPKDTEGTLDSVSTWSWLEVEQGPRGTVLLQGLRDGKSVNFEITPGTWEAVVRPWFPKVILDSYDRGRTLIDAGEIRPGVAIWREGAAESEVLDWQARSWFWLRIGETWKEARQWQETQKAYGQALELAGDSRTKIVVLQAMGRAYQKANELDLAGEAYEAALELREGSEGRSLSLAKDLEIIGRLASLRGDSGSAEHYSAQSLEIRQTLAPGSLAMASSLDDLGVLAQLRSDLFKAGEYLEAALKIRQELAPASRDLSISLNNLGVLSAVRGDLDRATEYFEKSLKIRQGLGSNPLDIAKGFENLGLVANMRGDAERARQYYDQSLETFLELAAGSPMLAKSLGNMGSLLLSLGDLEPAAQYFKRALRIQESLSPGGINVAKTKLNLGLVAQKLGNLDRAAEYYEESLEIIRRLAPGGPEVATVLSKLGKVELERQNLARAAELLEGAIEIHQRLAIASLSEIQALCDFAVVRREQSQLKMAAGLFRQAITALEDQLARLGGSQSTRADFRAAFEGCYRNSIQLFLELGQLEEAFFTLERFRAQTFLARLTERDLLFSGVPEDLEKQRRRLARQYDQTQREISQLLRQDQEAKAAALTDQLQRLRWQYDDVTEAIIKASPRQGSLHYPRSLDATAAAQALDPGTLMLSYSVSEENCIVFVLTSDGQLQVERLAVSEEELRGSIQDWKESILRASIDDATGASHTRRIVGRRLYQQLIKPVELAVLNSKRLLIVPDGPLHTLPWNALVRQTKPEDGGTEKPDQYLIEWRPLHIVLSATVYEQLRQDHRPRVGAKSAPALIELAAFGDPQYSGNHREAEDFRVRSAIERGLFDGWRALPHTREEVERISALYSPGAARVYLGKSATEEAAKSLGYEPRILHLAAHGHLDDQSPLDSAMVLSFPEKPGQELENGLLQVWEIFERVRLDADLVVLSACASGLGKEQSGEGLIGLTRAFQFAGARSVLASLWNVQDRTTADLMVRFYQHLRMGQSKDMALRSAQLDFIRSGQAENLQHSQPYYWAAFQIYGDWK